MKLIINEDLQESPELLNLYRLDAAINDIIEMGESEYLDLCLVELVKARVLYIAAFDLQDYDME